MIGGLSYSALSDFKNCGYRFYVERVLGIAEPESAAGEGPAAAPEARRRFGPGSRCTLCSSGAPATAGAIRAKTEPRRRCASRVWRTPRGEARCSRSRGLSRLPASRGVEGAAASAEVPFVLSVGGTLVRGSIDLLVERPDGSVLVVDYKTDRLEGRDPKRPSGATGPA